MRRWRAAVCVAAAVSATGAWAGDYLHPSGAAAWSERAQILYDAETRSVARRTVRVWNPSPGLDLDFTWEPEAGERAGGVGSDGVVAGQGKIVWRIKGSASYDPKTVFSTYAGRLRDGRPDGRGRLELRSGEVVDGDWRAGRIDGPAVWIDASGNRYEGDFRNGLPNGKGTYRTTTGEIFTGGFIDGRRDGEGETRLPGGTVYRSKWKDGREIGGNRPDVLADARVGGLLRAAGGDADRMEIAVAVEERMNQQSEMRYQHLVRDEDIAIYPVSEELNGLWNGGEIYSSSYMIDGVDWETSPAFVQVDLATTDGSRVKLKDLKLQVGSSEAYRKPMLTLTENYGCVGFRPNFVLVNHGWGDVRDARLNVQFTGEEAGGPASRTFSMPVDNFDTGADVDVRGLLDQAGVDTAKLENNRYTCPSMDSMNVCRSKVFNDVGFGEIADFVSGEDKLQTTLTGTLDYSWADDAGTVYQQSEAFRAAISLAVIEVPAELAECGDGFGGSPEALRYQDVYLPVGRQNYDIEMPVRGNKSISSYKARLKMHADQSSFHQMRVVADFADGSTRESKPVSLFYFRPRPVAFSSSAQPAQCYLKDEGGGC